MSTCLAKAVMAAGDGQDTVWINLLVVVVFAAGAGLWSSIRNRRKDSHGAMYRWKDNRVRRLKEAVKGGPGKWVGALVGSVREKTGGRQGTSGQPVSELNVKTPASARRNLAGGMELLKTDFLVRVVEQLAGEDARDVEMRRFSFTELVRRERLAEVSSEALTLYARDEHAVYGKQIQCRAMEELARRTFLSGQEETGKHQFRDRQVLVR